MDRRRFFRTAGAAVASTATLSLVASQRRSAAGSSSGGSARPNILYIMTDQQFAGAMSCAGCKDVKTPAMDSLAQSGVRFENAYCPFPLCVPCRVSMMTGRMPHEIGVARNVGTDFGIGGLPMMGRLFSDAGYDCGYAGKWHLPVTTEQKSLHGFEIAAKGGRKDSGILAAFARFLDTKRSQPFLYVASFVNPHNICQYARGEALPDGPIGDDPPPDRCPALPANFGIPDNEPEILRAIQKKDDQVYPTVGWPPERWRQYRWAYYRMIEKVDALIGGVLDALRKSGQEERTLVIFSCDHGDGMGAHRWNQKQALYEEVVRVPFIVSLKGATKAGLVDRTHLVSSGLDLLPTLCDWAGVEPPKIQRGLSVRALAEGREPKTWRDEVVAETAFSTRGGGAFGVKGRMVRTAKYKYVAYSEGRLREQLFDLEKDPGEMANLAMNVQYRDALNDHRRRLAAWCRQTQDAFEIPAGG
jgi:arylsulfatase A-like enzyme